MEYNGQRGMRRHLTRAREIAMQTQRYGIQVAAVAGLLAFSESPEPDWRSISSMMRCRWTIGWPRSSSPRTRYAGRCTGTISRTRNIRRAYRAAKQLWSRAGGLREALRSGPVETEAFVQEVAQINELFGPARENRFRVGRRRPLFPARARRAKWEPGQGARHSRPGGICQSPPHRRRAVGTAEGGDDRRRPGDSRTASPAPEFTWQ